MPVVKITNAQLLSAKQALDALAEQSQVPAALRWSAGQTKKALDALIKDLGEHEIALVREYAEVGPDGQLRQVPGQDGKPLPNTWVFKGHDAALALAAEDLEGRRAAEEAFLATRRAFQERHESLMGAENDLTVTPRPIGDFEKSNLSGNDLQAIWFLIKDE